MVSIIIPIIVTIAVCVYVGLYGWMSDDWFAQYGLLYFVMQISEIVNFFIVIEPRIKIFKAKQVLRRKLSALKNKSDELISSLDATDEDMELLEIEMKELYA